MVLGLVRFLGLVGFKVKFFSEESKLKKEYYLKVGRGRWKE